MAVNCNPQCCAKIPSGFHPTNTFYHSSTLQSEESLLVFESDPDDPWEMFKAYHNAASVRYVDCVSTGLSGASYWRLQDDVAIPDGPHRSVRPHMVAYGRSPG